MFDDIKDTSEQTFYKPNISDDDREYNYIFDTFLRFIENKIEFAKKNDYIINKIVTKTLNKEDIALITEHYKKMHNPNVKKAIENIDNITLKDFLVIGTWNNIPLKYISAPNLGSELFFEWLTTCINESKKKYADKEDWLLEMILDIMAENQSFGYSEENFKKFIKITEMSKEDRNKTIDKLLNDSNITNKEKIVFKTSKDDLLSCLITFIKTKIARAITNDFFIAKIYNKKLDDKDVSDLRKYYNSMSALIREETINSVLKSLENKTLNLDNYLPLGSWKSIPQNLIKSENFEDITIYYATLLLENPVKLLKDMEDEAIRFVYPQKLILEILGFLNLPSDELIKTTKETYKMIKERNVTL